LFFAVKSASNIAVSVLHCNFQKNKTPEPSGVEGLAYVRIIEVLLESAKSGLVVKSSTNAAHKRPTAAQEISKPAIEKRN
jgi:hypothetical protein